MAFSSHLIFSKCNFREENKNLHEKCCLLCHQNVEWDILVNRFKEKKTFYVCLQLRSLGVRGIWWPDVVFYFINSFKAPQDTCDGRLTVHVLRLSGTRPGSSLSLTEVKTLRSPVIHCHVCVFWSVELGEVVGIKGYRQWKVLLPLRWDSSNGKWLQTIVPRWCRLQLAQVHLRMESSWRELIFLIVSPVIVLRMASLLK